MILNKIDHRNVTESQLTPFFCKRGVARKELAYLQRFDLAGLQGRYLSSSYAFHEPHPRHGEAMHHLRELFAAHPSDGEVEFCYVTKIYFGQLA